MERVLLVAMLSLLIWQIPYRGMSNFPCQINHRSKRRPRLFEESLFFIA